MPCWRLADTANRHTRLLGRLTSSVPFSCGSAHPYANDSRLECSHTIPGATRLRVHFSSFETEQDPDPVDAVSISDGARQVQTLWGTPFGPSGERFSAAVRGDTIVVDVIAGLGGDDTIQGAGGNDTACGGTGNDSLRATPATSRHARRRRRHRRTG
jgi:hypothetical protein